ncbi:MAG: amidohydrolase family protein [Gemmatimonadales bacterium]
MLLASLLIFAVGVQDTTAYDVLNHGRPAGEMLVLRTADSVTVRYHHVDRNRGRRAEVRYRFSGQQVVGGATWQLPLYGPPGTPDPIDRFEVVANELRWTANDSARSAPRAPGAFYRLGNATPYDLALLAQYALRQRDSTARLVNAGTPARVEVIADTVVRLPLGSRRVRLALVHAGGRNPAAVWLDADGSLVASAVGWFITVRRGYQDALPTFRALEIAYRNSVAEALARELAPAAVPAVAIVNGDLFDSERGTIVPRTTVIIQGERITAVGPAGSVSIPAGARVIDATGKTVMPGMWDMHTHFQLTSQSGTALSQLATGVTTIRDLAADLDVAVSHRDRADRGMIVSPRVILGGFIEGPGAWAGPTEAIARDESEARAWVARYDSLGYRQIKLYNLVHPDLIPVIAEETHRRGMRLSGHVPRGITTPTAVRLGFDEINHAAFLFSTFYQDSLYLPRMRAYSAVAATVAAAVDVDGPEMTAMIELFRERGTVMDGTWNLWMSARSGVGPSVTGIPAQAFDSLGRLADANYLRAIKRLHDAGVPVVPGTDGSSYNAELEVYERAGIPAAEVLQLATITSARVMGDDGEYGSIEVGKVADVLVVDGRPAERVEDLRRLTHVIRAGRVYEPSALRSALEGGNLRTMRTMAPRPGGGR